VNGTNRHWTAGRPAELPTDATAVRWREGTVECRFRLLHPRGSLVADDGDHGVVLTDPAADCTICSDICST
jgi:hypothetical protein